MMSERATLIIGLWKVSTVRVKENHVEEPCIVTGFVYDHKRNLASGRVIIHNVRNIGSKLEAIKNNCEL